MKQNPRQKIAFTLAEVLITLGIIGVVAALTLPSLIQNKKNREYVTRLQKAYTNINAGFQQLIVNNGCGGETDALECTGIWGSNDTTYTLSDEVHRTQLIDELKKVFTVTHIEYCSEDNTSDICTVVYKFLKGSGASTQTTNVWTKNRLAMETVDGYVIYISQINCRDNHTEASVRFKKTCSWISIDSNGKKLPNQGGRDFFEYILSQSGYLVPVVGIDYALATAGETGLTTGNYWRISHSHCGIPDKPISEYNSFINGFNCAARIMENGWKMDY